MRSFKLLGLVLLTSMLFTSCAVVSSPLTGFIYTDVTSPVAVTDNEGASKVGKAEATSILGIVATGDASIDAAAKSAGITKIHHVDVQATSVLGIFAKYEILVYGE